MKYSKAGILKKKTVQPSDVLEVESKRMEERLIELREHMKLEKERRQSETRFKDGSRWRAAVTTKPMHGYADMVLKAKPRPPPQRPVSKGFVPTSELLNFEPDKEAESRAAQNLQRANTLPPPDAVGNEIRAFLESCGLEKHYETFIANGIDDMEVLLELTEEHLVNLNLPLGHRIKLLKRIRDSKNSVTKALEPLPPPQSEAAAGTDTNEGGALLKGDYNEAESYAMFKDALDMFRRGGTTTHHVSSEKVSPKASENKENKSDMKHVRFTEGQEAKEQKAWMATGETGWQPDAAVLATSEEGTDAALTSGSIVEGLMKEARDSCWECYKIFSEGKDFAEKRFCGEECLEAYKSKLYLTCACGNRFTKQEGELQTGTWYCSETCPSLPVQSPTPPDESIPVSQDMEDPDAPLEDFIAIDPATGDPVSLGLTQTG